MHIAQFLQSLVRSPTVGVDRASRVDGLLDEALQTGGGAIRHSAQTNSSKALSVFFCGDSDQGFALRITALGPGRRAADESFVHFDGSLQALASRANHAPAQLVEPTPRRLIAPQSKDSLHTQGAGSGLLARHQPSGPKPNLQRQVSSLEDGARSHGGLPAAILAGPAMPQIQPAHRSLAKRTNKATGPTQMGQVLTARILSSKPPLQFEQGLWIIFVHACILPVGVVVGKEIALLAELGALFPDRYFGELIFLAREGVLIVPSHMGARPIRGMHGYHPTDAHSYAALCTNQQIIPDDITSIPHIFRLMTRDADLAKTRNATQLSDCSGVAAALR